MSVKIVKSYSEIEDKIVRAVNTIADPVRQTLGPRGGNVIFETEKGDVTVTNDGFTIAKSIVLRDEFEDAIVQVIKQSALKTNTQAGDGTSTTILLSSILVKEGLRLIQDGYNQRDVTEAYRDFAKLMQKAISKQKIEIENDDDLLNVTKISANNDSEIAAMATKAIREAGEHGYLFLEPSNTGKDDIVIDSGFVVPAGMFTPELTNNPNGTATYDEVPVLVTDKRLYYAEEAETILNVCLQNGWNEVVIVAKDFVGEALPFFVANHNRGSIKVLLVKDPNVDKLKGATLSDLSIYLNGEFISESLGKIVDTLQIDNFCFAKKVYADANQTVIMREDEADDKKLKERVKALESDIKAMGEEDSDDKNTLKKRLASLTNGIVTVKVGGSTPVEVKERRYRYEDAIKAGQAAVKDGILLGGGVSLFNAYQNTKIKDVEPDFLRVYSKVAEANIRQIADNAGMQSDAVIKMVAELKDGWGFNALTKEYVDMKEAGIFDPYRVTEMAIENSVSIANAIISSRYLIVNERDYGRKEETNE